MPARRLRSASELPRRLTALAVLLALIGGQPARAGMFDDEEARRQIKDLSIQSNERFDTLSKAQIDLVNQIQALREDNARLRGQIETLTYELDSAKKRQQDLYVDVDTRVRKLETPPAASNTGAPPTADGGATAEAAPPQAATSDPAAETREYEAALNLFRANKIKDAAGAFEGFVRAHPDSTLAPNAQYWLGNSHYSLRDCKKAIDAHRVVVAKWPQHPKAPDALINIATCQQEQGDAKGARATLDTVLAKYPDSSAAATARQRLKK
ncbi:tol-pal system protein YbgF [Propionivibrio soli]|uniref:tol-pal system protein YbgF n=1 Tax=Propionivibrio soli TaxID=2976531 RepID=UPI0021E70C4C|nr:tol-pal system protein YbgF [Propionivibrio soli]